MKFDDVTRDMIMVDDPTAFDDPARLPEGVVPQSELQVRDAVPPPPGYRYTPDGRLVPFVRATLPLDSEIGQKLFCEILEITGSFRTACDALCVSNPQTVRTAMNKDVTFAEAVEASAQRHRDAIYAVALQRATRGYQVPIVGGKDKNEIVAYETRYSDTILKMLLIRHFPEFREAARANQPSVTFVKNQQNNTQVNIGLPDARKMTRAQRDAARLLMGQDPSTPEADPAGVIDVEDKTS